MRKSIKILIIAIIVLIALVFSYASVVGIDNFKLSLTRFLGFFTINNNPLLKSYDKDFLDIKSSDSLEPRVDFSELVSGGQSKDGIPSIDDPKFVSIKDSEFNDWEIVIGVVLDGEERAYPYGILNWHEIINDKIGDTPITVTLCPLCDTSPVYIRKVNGQETTFGVSGKLFQSCLVMYDRLSDSLWSQPWGIGIVGKNTNIELERVPAVKTTLGQWFKKYPESKIMTSKTGYKRNYFRYPYGSYSTDSSLVYPVRNQDKLDLHPKEIVSYIWKFDDKNIKNNFSGESKQFSHKEIEKKGRLKFEFNGQSTQAVWNSELSTIEFFAGYNKIPASTAFAFVYPAYFE